MKVIRRAISIFCLASLVASFSACAGTSPETTNPELSTTGDTEILSTEPADTPKDMLSERKSVDDGLGNRDFGGITVNIAINTFCEDGFFKKEQTGDVLDDSIYKRNNTVEERFNVKLNYISKTYDDIYNDVLNTVTAGDDEYQIVAEHAIVAGKFVTGDLVTNWYDVPNVDFEKPWWSASNINDLTIDGVCFLAVGDFALTTIGRTYCMAYDKVAAQSYKLPNMYDLVYSGKWTIDKLIELTKDTYSDLNKNNERDTEDYYGFSTSTASKIDTYLWSFDNPIFKKNNKDELILVINSEKITSILEKLVSFCWDNPDVYYDINYKKDSNDKHYISEEKFSKGTTLIASAMLESGIKYFRSTENDYGIIPYPKWDEVQKDYYTIVDGGFTALSIPKTVSNLDMAGTITEALCAETYRSVVPVYYDKALKEKGTRDDESKKMIDFVISKRIFDFGYVYDGWKGYGFKLETMVKDKDTGFASMYASTINKVKDYYGSVIKVFTDTK